MAKHVDYYVSLNSPWTYLASKRLETIAAKHGADITIWPVDFGSVFSVSGGLPLPKRAPQRQAYRLMELKRWKEHLGVPIVIHPKFFPVDAGPAAALIAAAPAEKRMALAGDLLSALWKDDRNLADPALLKEIGAKHGVAEGSKP